MYFYLKNLEKFCAKNLEAIFKNICINLRVFRTQLIIVDQAEKVLQKSTINVTRNFNFYPLKIRIEN